MVNPYLPIQLGGWGLGRRALAEKGTLLMSKGFYGDALVVYDKCLNIQLQVLVLAGPGPGGPESGRPGGREEGPGSWRARVLAGPGPDPMPTGTAAAHGAGAGAGAGPCDGYAGAGAGPRPHARVSCAVDARGADGAEGVVRTRARGAL
jgi:hypothetical protein